MRVIDEVNLLPVATTANVDSIKKLLNEIFWRWFDVSQDRKVKTIRLWFISKTIYIRDLWEVFELLFGPHP